MMGAKRPKSIARTGFLPGGAMAGMPVYDLDPDVMETIVHEPPHGLLDGFRHVA